MIIEYINEEENNISCQVDEITENNIIHIIDLLNSDCAEPLLHKKWNFYVTKQEKLDVLRIFDVINNSNNILNLNEEELPKVNFKSFMHPSLGTVTLIDINYSSIYELIEFRKEEHLKWVESVKRLDPTAEYDEELGIFKL